SSFSGPVRNPSQGCAATLAGRTNPFQDEESIPPAPPARACRPTRPFRFPQRAFVARRARGAKPNPRGPTGHLNEWRNSVMQSPFAPQNLLNSGFFLTSPGTRDRLRVGAADVPVAQAVGNSPPTPPFERGDSPSRSLPPFQVGAGGVGSPTRLACTPAAR